MTNFRKFTHARAHHALGLIAVAELRAMGHVQSARMLLAMVRDHRIGHKHLFAPLGG